MYDKKTRELAMSLVESGLSPRQASLRMGGKPGHAIIRMWTEGYEPTAKRRRARLYSLDEKLDVLKRISNGENYKDVAEEMGCAATTILTWRRMYNEHGADGLRTRLDER